MLLCFRHGCVCVCLFVSDSISSPIQFNLVSYNPSIYTLTHHLVIYSLHGLHHPHCLFRSSRSFFILSIHRHRYRQRIISIIPPVLILGTCKHWSILWFPTLHGSRNTWPCSPLFSPSLLDTLGIFTSEDTACFTFAFTTAHSNWNTVSHPLISPSSFSHLISR